jgi:hypothetical protein
VALLEALVSIGGVKEFTAETFRSTATEFMGNPAGKSCITIAEGLAASVTIARGKEGGSDERDTREAWRGEISAGIVR